MKRVHPQAAKLASYLATPSQQGGSVPAVAGNPKASKELRRETKILILIAAGLLILSLTITAAAQPFADRDAEGFVANSVPANAGVVATGYTDGRNPEPQYQVLFIDGEGKQHKKWIVGEPDLDANDRVLIYYDPENPMRAADPDHVPSDRAARLQSIAGVGILAGVIGLVFLGLRWWRYYRVIRRGRWNHAIFSDTDAPWTADLCNQEATVCFHPADLDWTPPPPPTSPWEIALPCLGPSVSDATPVARSRHNPTSYTGQVCFGPGRKIGIWSDSGSLTLASLPRTDRQAKRWRKRFAKNSKA